MLVAPCQMGSYSGQTDRQTHRQARQNIRFRLDIYLPSLPFPSTGIGRTIYPFTPYPNLVGWLGGAGGVGGKYCRAG